MPNLLQLVSLKEEYGILNQQEFSARNFIENHLVSDATIRKGFNVSKIKVLEHFDIAKVSSDIVDYFESNPTEDVVLLFIDIANFSTITDLKDSKSIGNYLDSFYRKALPIIYKYGGQVEKIMGDGIVCVFGVPFINVDWPQEFHRAELCSRALVQKFKDTNQEVKIALHSGEITYYKTPGSEYTEYTMIGKPLTELFRLESVSMKNAVNFYANSVYDSVKPNRLLGLSAIKRDEVEIRGFDVELPGVDYDRVRYMKFI
jgi:class 3 adenylate cyclase